MNRGQKIGTAVAVLLAVEVLPVSIVATRMLIGGVEVTYEVDDKELNQFEADTLRAMHVAERDMGAKVIE